MSCEIKLGLVEDISRITTYQQVHMHPYRASYSGYKAIITQF